MPSRLLKQEQLVHLVALQPSLACMPTRAQESHGVDNKDFTPNQRHAYACHEKRYKIMGSLQAALALALQQSETVPDGWVLPSSTALHAALCEREIGTLCAACMLHTQDHARTPQPTCSNDKLHQERHTMTPFLQGCN